MMDINKYLRAMTIMWISPAIYEDIQVRDELINNRMKQELVSIISESPFVLEDYEHISDEIFPPNWPGMTIENMYLVRRTWNVKPGTRIHDVLENE